MQKKILLKPVKKIYGNIKLPGSKSISNRVLLLSAMAKGKTCLRNILDSEDVSHMLKALKLFNIRYSLSKKKKTCSVVGIGKPLYSKKNISLYLGNSGTAIRFLLASLSLKKNNTLLTGNKRMQERPIGDLVNALIQGQAKISFLKKKKYPPIKSNGGFIGGEIHIKGSISSQFLTALLIACPMAKKNTKIFVHGFLVSKPYILLTLKLMNIFGIFIKNNNFKSFYIKGNQQYKSPKKFTIEGDASSASYFLSAAAIKGGTVKVFGINKNSIQGDIRYAEVLKKIGAIIKYGKNFISCKKNSLTGIKIDMNDIPDVAMTLAIVALFCKGKTKIKNIKNWRFKETDRLKAMTTELRKIGAIVIEKLDSITIFPPKKFFYTVIDTYKDHRMAMCFSLLALSKLGISINNPKCTSKTFPNYFKKFLNLAHF